MLQWARVKRAGMVPQPRTSFGLAVHRGRAFIFGGVADQAGRGDRMFSENFDEMYHFNMDPCLRRWFPVTVRAPKKTAASAGALVRGRLYMMRTLQEKHCSSRYWADRPWAWFERDFCDLFCVLIELELMSLLPLCTAGSRDVRTTCGSC